MDATLHEQPLSDLFILATIAVTHDVPVPQFFRHDESAVAFADDVLPHVLVMDEAAA